MSEIQLEKGLTLVKPYFFGKIPLTFNEDDDAGINWDDLGVSPKNDDTTVVYDNAIVNIKNAVVISPAIDEDNVPCVRISLSDGNYFVVYTTIEKIIDECFTNKTV